MCGSPTCQIISPVLAKCPPPGLMLWLKSKSLAQEAGRHVVSAAAHKRQTWPRQWLPLQQYIAKFRTNVDENGEPFSAGTDRRYEMRLQRKYSHVVRFVAANQIWTTTRGARAVTNKPTKTTPTVKIPGASLKSAPSPPRQLPPCMRTQHASTACKVTNQKKNTLLFSPTQLAIQGQW